MNRYFFTLLYLISSINIFSQNIIYKGVITYGDSLLPKLIQFDERLPRSTDAQQVFADNLELTTMDSFVKVSEVTDKLGRLHEKYQQYYNGIKVEGGIYNVHYTLASEIAALNGYFYPVNNVSVTPNMSESTALNYALNTVNAQEYVWQNNESEQWLRTESNDNNATFYPQGELMLLPDSMGYNQQLVYRFNIMSSQPFNSQVLYVDAVNGNVVEQYSTFSNAFGDACTHYSGTVPIEQL